MNKHPRHEETPFERRSCYDCAHLIARVSWWCSNKDAIRDRGTAIPGCIHCPHWSPDYSMIKYEPIPYEERNGYRNPMEEEKASDKATRIIKFVIGALLVMFSIVWAYTRY